MFLIIDYFIWHYTVAPIKIVYLLQNYSSAIWHRFFIVTHLRTLFSPWHRLRSKYIFSSQKFTDKLGNFIFEIFIRLLAASVRLCIIITGLLTQTLLFILFLIIFACWIFWPMLVFIFLGKGLVLIF